MVENSLRARTITLAAICQAVLMIQQVARGRIIDGDSLNSLLSALMVRTPDSIFDVYNSIDDLYDGSQLLIKQLSGQADKKEVELTRYLAGILSLTKKLLKNSQALTSLGEELDKVQRRLEHFELTSPSIIENFADCYAKVISPIGQKIQVFGDPDSLKQTNIQHKVRALLLAGIRAAVLWRQLGGKRRQLIFNRKQILQDAILFHKELTSIS